MALTKAGLVQPQSMSTVERDLLVLAGVDSGRLVYNETTKHLQQWDGLRWVDVLNADSSLAGGKLGGVVSGALVDQLDAAKLTGVMDEARLLQLNGSKLHGDVDGGVY